MFERLRPKVYFFLLAACCACEPHESNSTTAQRSEKPLEPTHADITAQFHRNVNDRSAPFEFDLTLQSNSSSQFIHRSLSYSLSLFSLDNEMVNTLGCIELEAARWRNTTRGLYQRFSRLRDPETGITFKLEPGAYRYELQMFDDLTCDSAALTSSVSHTLEILSPPLGEISASVLPLCSMSRTSKSAAKPALLALAIVPDPADVIPPHNFSTSVTFAPNNDCIWIWKSTALYIQGEGNVIGGAKACSNSPRPDIEWTDAVAQHTTVFQSNNNWGADFDWRLFNGDFRFTFKLYSEPNCQGDPIWKISKTTNFRAASMPQGDLF
jgi:hypothetical protein